MRGSYLNDPCRELRSGEPDDEDVAPPATADHLADPLAEVAESIEMCARVCEERADELPYGQAQTELRNIARDLREGKVPSGIKQCASCGIVTTERPSWWTDEKWNYCNDCEARKL